ANVVQQATHFVKSRADESTQARAPMAAQTERISPKLPAPKPLLQRPLSDREARSAEIINRLEQININKITPLQALNLLHELRQDLDRKAPSSLFPLAEYQ